ncbi:serine/threonine protein kinase [Paenibacillus filicis]|uniref:Serine/threonine protein kinase n=2 Tax=Paenibacillus gyeongsangnamensis TaxID=3388067 RepID=A0ABT4QCK3_9BACL|nr:serine/threonine protein kinase [Paenibacillus filicis]MCZ8514521.1 serine/threonine protein kinase [Paenibacillus filicis]
MIAEVNQGLLPELRLASEHPHHPVTVHSVSAPWQLVGAGNYAAVVEHPEYSGLVVKVYAPGRPGIEAEAEVYRRLGKHPAYSECCYSRVKSGFLILRKLHGTTLYDCLRQGIPVPQKVMQDIDEALAYARRLGLTPHDVHGKNVMMREGRGIVVDVSDFMNPEPCTMWSDLKRAYKLLYPPWLRRIPVPDLLLDVIRRGYRLLKRR